MRKYNPQLKLINSHKKLRQIRLHSEQTTSPLRHPPQLDNHLLDMDVPFTNSISMPFEQKCRSQVKFVQSIFTPKPSKPNVKILNNCIKREQGFREGKNVSLDAKMMNIQKKLKHNQRVTELKDKIIKMLKLENHSLFMRPKQDIQRKVSTLITTPMKYSPVRDKNKELGNRQILSLDCKGYIQHKSTNKTPLWKPQKLATIRKNQIQIVINKSRQKKTQRIPLKSQEEKKKSDLQEEDNLTLNSIKVELEQFRRDRVAIK